MASKQSAVSDQSRQEEYRPATNVHRANASPDLEHSDSDEIRDGIDVTRHRMDETLDELGERLSPRHLMDDLWEMLRSERGRHAAHQVSDSMGEFGQNLGRQVRDNPVPTLLIGAGLAWMALGGQRSRSHEDEPWDDERDWSARGGHRDPDFWTDDDLLLDIEGDAAMSQSSQSLGDRGHIVVPEEYGEERSSAGKGESWKDAAGKKAAAAGHSVSSAASGAKDSASKAAGRVGEKVSGAASAAGSAVESTKDSVAHAAHSMGSSVAGTAAQIKRGAKSGSRAAYERSRAAGRGLSHSGRSAGRYVSRKTHSGGEQIADAYRAGHEKFAQATNEYPLGVGLGFLALGMLAGLVAPRTRYEDELMGEASDEMAHRVAETGEELFERGKEVVEQTVDTAKQSAEQHGLTGDSLAERATHVVEKSAAAIREAAKEESLTPSAVTEEVKHVADDVKKTAAESVDKATTEAKQKAEEVDPDVGKAVDRNRESTNPAAP